MSTKSTLSQDGNHELMLEQLEGKVYLELNYPEYLCFSNNRLIVNIPKETMTKISKAWLKEQKISLKA